MSARFIQIEDTIWNVELIKKVVRGKNKTIFFIEELDFEIHDPSGLIMNAFETRGKEEKYL